jgi:hypothetical protein
MAALLSAGLLASASTALAAGPGQSFFELDASQDPGTGAAPKSAVTDNSGASTPDDWDRVANGTFHGTAKSFDSETTATGTADSQTIFTGGGSKDPLPISGWGWKNNVGGLPDKDNLLHAMTARYGASATAHIYFAADRFDNSGDSQIGFWFFNSKVGLNADGSFSGVHKAGVVPHDPNNAGDVLILSDFTQGGTQPTIRIYEYVGSGGSDGALNLLGGNATDVRDCATVSTDDFCASVNPKDGATAPWLFKNKSGQTTFGHGEFYEGGLNLTSLGLQNECFSSFLAETRSSQSTTATLKDFVSGPFQDCSTSLVTTPSLGQNGSASISTAGSVTVHDTAALTVNGTATFTGTLAFHLCGPMDTGNCATGGNAVAAASGVNPVTVNGNYNSADVNLTAAGRYCWRADFTSGTPGVPNASDPGSTSTSTSECFRLTPVDPSISTNASADVLIGNSIDDTATLSGTAKDPDGTKADGTITFRLYGPNDSTCSTPIETSVVTITNGGDGDYSASSGAKSGSLGSLTPVAAGTYRWIASYSGDSPNTNPVSGACNDTHESVVVNPGQPVITTQATSASGSPVGTAIDDTAHLTGTVNQPNGTAAGGTITFSLYGPDDATCGTAIATRTLTVSGDGYYTASAGAGTGSLTPTLPGTYRWVASYSGNLPNTQSVSGKCNDLNEASLLVTLQPSLSTAQSWVPNDSATVSVASGGGSLAGSIRFRLYSNATCTASDTTLYDKSFTIGSAGELSSDGLSWTVSTDNTTAYGASGTFSWLVQYTSTNAGHTNVTSACNVENSTLTVNNGSTSTTP